MSRWSRLALDEIDVAILECLQRDGRMSIRSLADVVKISKSSVGERLTSLKCNGVLLGFRAVIAASALGAEFDILIHLTLHSSNPRALLEFELEVQRTRNILSFVRTGSGVYHIRVGARDVVRAIEGVAAERGIAIAHARIEPILDEIVAYREQPVRAFLRAGANS